MMIVKLLRHGSPGSRIACTSSPPWRSEVLCLAPMSTCVARWNIRIQRER